jgi:hypothetical protein
MSLKGALNTIGIEAMPTINDTLVEFSQFLKDNRANIRAFSSAIGAGFSFAGKVVGELFTAVSVGIEVVRGAYEYWVDAFANFFQRMDDGAHAVAGFFMSVKDTITETYTTAVEGVAYTIEYWVRKGEELAQWGSGLVDTVTGWVTSIPDALTQALSDARQFVEIWWADLRTSAESWVSGIISDLSARLTSRLSDLSDTLSQIPLIGSILSGASEDGAKALTGGGGVTIQVHNSVDARGATPGAGAEVRRAVQASSGEAGASVSAALASYQSLSYAGGM